MNHRHFGHGFLWTTAAQQKNPAKATRLTPTSVPIPGSAAGGQSCVVGDLAQRHKPHCMVSSSARTPNRPHALKKKKVSGPLVYLGRKFGVSGIQSEREGIGALALHVQQTISKVTMSGRGPARHMPGTSAVGSYQFVVRQRWTLVVKMLTDLCNP